MNPKLCIPSYRKEKNLYRKLNNILFWYKKYKRLGWIKGENFGDYLSLIVVGEIIKKENIIIQKTTKNKKLLAIGSILHFAKTDNTIWGSGINGSMPIHRYKFQNLDVRMLRGPLSKSFLEERGIKTCEVLGDPAILLPTLLPELSKKTEKGKVIAIPHMNEFNKCINNIPKNIKIISPLWHWKVVLEEILTSELVLSSSLHGVIVSEAFGVPVRFLMPTSGETILKYNDYYQATGRSLKEEPSNFLGKVNEQSGIIMPEPVFDTKAMLEAFPRDLFEDKQ